MRGQNAREYLKEVAYKDAIPEFKAKLAEIGSQQGWTLEDLQKRFSNELWDDMVFDIKKGGANGNGIGHERADHVGKQNGRVLNGHGHGQ
jgi:hypothetical protein